MEFRVGDEGLGCRVQGLVRLRDSPIDRGTRGGGSG